MFIFPDMRMSFQLSCAVTYRFTRQKGINTVDEFVSLWRMDVPGTAEGEVQGSIVGIGFGQLSVLIPLLF
jgi:hypothetical protein